MHESYLYHSFPRRGAGGTNEIVKGLSVLQSICDAGLLLVPEQIEWRQPLSDGSDRVFPVLQKRVCFTDLEPRQLVDHSQVFGHFSLEFDHETVRQMGGVPVFYIPQSARNSDACALGVGLMAALSDAQTIIRRMSWLQQILNGDQPVPEVLKVDFGFARSPDARQEFEINSRELRKSIDGISHNVTPLSMLHDNLDAFKNFFYPADDIVRSAPLSYYSQREWRIACEISVENTPLTRALSEEERRGLISIDTGFFSRLIRTDVSEHTLLDLSLVHSGLRGRSPIELARRVIVPNEALDSARSMLERFEFAPKVICLDEFDHERSKCAL